MKIAYNPLGSAAYIPAADNKDLIFDLVTRTIYAKGIPFDGTKYNTFKKHTSPDNTGGSEGLVPIPSYSALNNRLLREDGLWVLIAGVSAPDDALSLESTNSVENKVITKKFNEIIALLLLKAEHVYKNIVINGVLLLAQGANDTLTIIQGDGIALTPNSDNKSITISTKALGLLGISTSYIDGQLVVKVDDLYFNHWNEVFNWYQSVTAEDTDLYINKWLEIVDFLNNVQLGTNILDEFVTRKTSQEIIGAKTFTLPITSTVAIGTSPFVISSATLVTNLNADLWDDKHLYKSFEDSENIDSSALLWGSNGASAGLPSMQYATVLNVNGAVGRRWLIWNSRQNHLLYWRPELPDMSGYAPEHILLDSLNYKGFIELMYWANILILSEPDSTTIPTLGGAIINGRTVITSFDRYALTLNSTTDKVVMSFFGNDDSEKAHFGISSTNFYGFNYEAYRNNQFGVTAFGIDNTSNFYLGTGGSPSVANSKMVVLANGNVGIGIPNPTHKLHVAGNIRVTTPNAPSLVEVYPYGYHDTYAGIVGHMSTTTSSDISHGLIFNTSIATTNNGKNALTLFNNRGNSYYQALGHYFTGIFRQLYTDSANGSVIHSILNYSTSPYGLVTRIYNDGCVSLQSLRETTSTEYFSLSLNPLGGNVGIGTISPSAKLHVIGESKFTDTMHVYADSSGNYTEGIRLYGTAKNSTWSNILFGCDPAVTNGTHVNQWLIGRRDDNNFVFRNNATDKTVMYPNGNIVMSGSLHLSYATSATMTTDSANPQIIFSENGGLKVLLMYTDYDSYRSPAGLKVLGEQGGEWFEVVGEIYSGSNILAANNFGINSTAGGGRGISLYGGSGYVNTYGIAFNQTFNWGTHGLVSSDWATYFTMSNTSNRGWIFRTTAKNVFSINTAGYLHSDSSGYFAGNLSSANSGASSPGDAALEVREYARAGTNTSVAPHSLMYAPRIGFHWGNRYWGNLIFFDGAFRFMDNSASSYISTYTGQLTAIVSTYPSLICRATSGSESNIRFDIGSAVKGYVGYNTSQGAWVYNAACGKYLALSDGGLPHVSGKQLAMCHSTSFNTDAEADDTTASSITDFFTRLNYSGLFTNNFGMCRGSWWYVGNTQYNTGVGTLEMAGTAVLNMSASADTGANYKSLLFLTAYGDLYSYASEESGVATWSRYSKEGHSHRVTKLHRSDGSDDYYLRHYWTGSYWYLQGYYGSSYHAGVQVAYANNAGTASAVTINYNNDSNSTYQMLWGSGNYVYGTGGIYCNPYTDYLYAGSFYCGNWFRSSGVSGWYNESYGGGIYMEDSTWVRIYNGKKLYVGNGEASAIHSAGGVYVAGCVHAYANYLKSTCNGHTVTIGSLNSSWCHIETSAPLFYINKSVLANGHFYEYSDIRKKNVIQKIEEFDLSKASIIQFKWKHDPTDIHIGVIALEIEEIVPEVVNTDPDGYKSVDYGVLGTVSGILAIKKISKLLEKIESLEKEIEILKNKN